MWRSRSGARLRLVPTVLAVDRATSGLDLGLAVAAGVLGTALGVLAAILAAMLFTGWRITTPMTAPPLAASVRPLGQPDEPGV